MTMTDGDMPLPPPPNERLRASLSEKLFPDEHRTLQRIAHFEIQGPGVEGGMGVVFRAIDTTLDRTVALKLLRHELVGSGGQRAHVLREAKALARVSHPNVVPVYEVREHDDAVYFVMEYVDGVTLREWQRERTWKAIVAMYVDAARGLAAAHAANLVHRDFKPDNVLVGEDGRCRVADFGIALVAERVPTTASRDAITTATGPEPSRPNAGTHGYMAPEQHGEGPVTARSDQFSFCVSLWEALYGVRPFARESLKALAAEPARVIPPNPGSFRGPRRLRRILQRGLAVKPEQRLASMTTLAAELERVLHKRSRVAVAAVALAGSGLLWWLWFMPGLDHCTDRAAELAAVWGPEPRERLSQSLAYEHRWASHAAELVAEQLDAHATRWRHAWEQACTMSPLARRKPTSQQSLALACLERQLRELDLLVQHLHEGSANVVARAEAMVVALEPPARCLEGNLELHRADLAHGELLEQAYEDLAELRFMAASGDVTGADALIERALERVHTWTESPVLAETLFAAARVDVERSRIDEAVARLQDAGQLAIALFHDELAAAVWSELAKVLAERTDRVAEAEMLARVADGVIGRVHRADRAQQLRLHHALTRAELAAARGELREAVDILESARTEVVAPPRGALRGDEAVIGVPDESERLRGTVDRKLANLLVDMGEFDAAEARYAALRERAVLRLGEQHPDVAKTDFDLALTLRGRAEAGDPRAVALRKACRELTERVLARVIDIYGADSANEHGPLVVLGEIAIAEGELAVAEALVERALRIEAQHFDSTTPEWGAALGLRARLAQARGDSATWASALEALLEAWRRGPNASQRPNLLNDLGWVRGQRGEWEAAWSVYEQLRLETDSPYWQAMALAGTGRALRGLGRGEAARPYLERARDLALTLVPRDGTIDALHQEIVDDLAALDH